MLRKLPNFAKSCTYKKPLRRNISNPPPEPEFDLQYLCDPNNVEEISKNIAVRKGVGNIRLVNDLKNQLELESLNEGVRALLLEELHKIPNKTHPDVLAYKEEPKVLSYLGNKREFDVEPKEFHEITKRLNLVRTDQLGNVSGSRSYYFLGQMAQLEQALIQYTFSKLHRAGFKFVSVPDVLPRSVIESCGMNTRGERTQVYFLDSKLHGDDLCLSGTSEMALAGYFANKIIDGEKLPVKLATVSQCYRAETSSMAEEKGIYRVHQFTKVEMFVVCAPNRSDEMLEDLRQFEESHFESLGLHLRTLDMPPQELGAPAYRKYDVEAWLPGRKTFGEVSSCSNCTDFQARRLGIKFKLGDKLQHVHTLNGTACAIPRMLIAIVESFQNSSRKTVSVPEALRPYMQGVVEIGRQKRVPELALVKNKSSNKK